MNHLKIEENYFEVVCPNGKSIFYRKGCDGKPAKPLPDVPQIRENIPEWLELNPPYDYKAHVPAPRKPSKELVVTIKPIEQTGLVEDEKEEENIPWDLHYDRIHNKKTRKWFYRLKSGIPKKKKKDQNKNQDNRNF